MILDTYSKSMYILVIPDTHAIAKTTALAYSHNHARLNFKSYLHSPLIQNYLGKRRVCIYLKHKKDLTILYLDISDSWYTC